MTFFRGSRSRRIDRALSNVLDRIYDDEQEQMQSCNTWTEIDRLSIRMNSRRTNAYAKAEKLHAKRAWNEEY